MFELPDAQLRPSQWLVGTLKSFGDLTAPKEGKRYYSERCWIKGTGGERDQRFDFRWAPEFFKATVTKASLDKSALWVYQTHINVNSKDKIATLPGLCGSAEVWADFVEQAKGIAGAGPADIHEFLKEFFLTLGPVPFLYKLEQESKYEGKDENGKAIVTRGPYMEVTEFAYLDEKTVKRIVRQVERVNKRISDAKANGTDAPAGLVIRFDPADYGIEVQLPEVDEPAWAVA